MTKFGEWFKSYWEVFQAGAIIAFVSIFIAFGLTLGFALGVAVVKPNISITLAFPEPPQ